MEYHTDTESSISSPRFKLIVLFCSLLFAIDGDGPTPLITLMHINLNSKKMGKFKSRTPAELLANRQQQQQDLESN